MKKIVLLATVLLIFSLTASIASARVFFGFGFAFPPVVIGPRSFQLPHRPTTLIRTVTMATGCGCRVTAIRDGLSAVARESGSRGTGSIAP